MAEILKTGPSGEYTVEELVEYLRKIQARRTFGQTTIKYNNGKFIYVHCEYGMKPGEPLR